MGINKSWKHLQHSGRSMSLLKNIQILLMNAEGKICLFSFSFIQLIFLVQTTGKYRSIRSLTNLICIVFYFGVCGILPQAWAIYATLSKILPPLPPARPEQMVFPHNLATRMVKHNALIPFSSPSPFLYQIRLDTNTKISQF